MRAASALVAFLALPALAFGALVPRSLLDVCAHVELNLLLGLGLVTDILDILNIHLPIEANGDIDVCLCLSALPVFLTANVNAAAAVQLAGENAVSAFLAATINDLAGGQKCQYPAHSTAVCTDATPCGWTCDTGYYKSGTECLPVVTGPSARAARSLAVPSCARAGERVCGTANGKSQWECVNVLSELESCGGCTFAPPFPVLASTTPLGTDCTAIPDVSDVRCSMGACIVQKCNDGFVPSSDRSTCLPAVSISVSGNKSLIKGGKHAHAYGNHAVADILGQMVGIVTGN